MRRWTTVMAGVVAAWPCATTSAAPPASLTSSGSWAVDITDDGCTLSRPFGTGDQAVTIGFLPMFKADTIEIIVVSHDDSGAQRRGFAEITEEPGGSPERAKYFSVVDRESRTRVTRVAVPRAIWSGLDATATFAIKASPINVRVAIAHFSAAKVAFDRCEADTLRAWGVDPATLTSATGPRLLDPSLRIFQPEDYPALAQRAGKLGRVVTILTVDPAGKVGDCRIGSGSWPELNAITCEKARSIAFEPAHDAAGKAIASIYVLQVRWCLDRYTC